MKSRIILLLFILYSIYSSGQSCLPNGITFANQAQVDSFPILYPDCKEIGGDVIFEDTNIRSLDSLYNIVKIGGNLYINDINCASLSGLDNLRKIGGSLHLVECRNLKSIKNLSNLDSIGKDLRIKDPFQLENLSGLEGITKINNNLTISNHNMPSIEGIHNIEEIGKDLSISNFSLKDYSALRNLKRVEGRFQISASIIPNLKGFEKLEFVQNLTINGTVYLVSLDGLKSLTTVSERLTISGDSVRDISALRHLNYLGGLWIKQCPSLENLHGLEQITTMPYHGLLMSEMPKIKSLHELSNLTYTKKGMYLAEFINLENLYGLHNLSNLDSVVYDMFISYMSIANNKKLNNCNLDNICEYLQNGGVGGFAKNGIGCSTREEILTACGTKICPDGDVYLHSQSAVDSFRIRYPDCQNIYGSLYITDTSIDDLQSLQQIQRIYGNLSITGCPQLQTINGFDSLKLLTGTLDIAENDALVSVPTFGQIHTLDGDLILQDNPLLSGVEGLTQLRNIWGNIDLSGNENMVDLDWLQSLGRVDENIYIFDNLRLRSLSGLDKISTYHLDTIFVGDNASLSFCAIESICQRLQETTVDTFYQNNTGCDDRLEVIGACTSSIEDDSPFSELKVFPNPTNGVLIFYGIDFDQKNYHIEIYDMMGLRLGSMTLNENRLDISHLSSGIYLLKIVHADGGYENMKVIKF